MTHREMVIGDIVDHEYVAQLLVRRLKTMFGTSYEQLAGQFHTGGVIKSRPPQPLREGVVGYTVTGQPIYDGDWFDKQMGKLGPSVTVMVNGGYC